MPLHRLTQIVMGVPNVEQTASYYADFWLAPVPGAAAALGDLPALISDLRRQVADPAPGQVPGVGAADPGASAADPAVSAPARA